MCNINEQQNEIYAMPALASNVDMTEDILAAANRRVAQLDKIISLALKRTNNQDWVDQQGKPYLCASGAEKIARLFGVCWKDVKCEKIISNDEKGQFYYFEYSAVFMLGTDNITAIGTCSQKDQFFAKTKEGMKPASEIDETNIRKAAYSNMVVNGVSRILGIRNLTWAELEVAGIKRGQTAKVSYKDRNDHSNDMPENPADWAEWLTKQENPKLYYGTIKNSAAAQDIKNACFNIMYPKTGSAQ